MAKKRVTPRAKPDGQSAFTPLELSQRLMVLEENHSVMHRDIAKLVTVVRDLGYVGRIKPIPSPAQTSAAPMTAAERAEAEGEGKLRARIATEVRDWSLRRFERELAGKDLNFIATVWIEMLAVTIAGSVDLDGNLNGQMIASSVAVGEQLNRRVRAYVATRQATPERVN